eukprot:326505-Alexandrium_andersonii.AAC.1
MAPPSPAGDALLSRPRCTSRVLRPCTGRWHAGSGAALVCGARAWCISTVMGGGDDSSCSPCM